MFTLEQAMKALRDVEVTYSFTLSLTSALMGWVVIATPRPLYPRERPSAHCIGGNVHPRTGHEGPEGCRGYLWLYSFFNISADGVGGHRHAPAALPPGKTRCPLYRRMGGPQGRSGRVLKISTPGSASPQRVAIPTELSRPTGIFVRCEHEVLRSGYV